MKIIGLTGGIASGKSSVADFLRQKKYPIVDFDRIVHKVIISSAAVQIKYEFGTINRATLVAKVIPNLKKMEKLEKIIYPYLLDRVDSLTKAYKKAGEDICFWDCPLLFEKNWDKKVNETLVILTQPEKQIERAQSRNRWAKSFIKKVMKLQTTNEIREQKANHLIWNDGDLEELKVKTFIALNNILEKNNENF